MAFSQVVLHCVRHACDFHTDPQPNSQHVLQSLNLGNLFFQPQGCLAVRAMDGAWTMIMERTPGTCRMLAIPK
eukprot:4615834-Karenia_brevis.AAC.1